MPEFYTAITFPTQWGTIVNVFETDIFGQIINLYGCYRIKSVW